MEAKEYRRWALDGLRERARERGIPVTGRKNEPRLLLGQSGGLSIFYLENWWRSAFKRSGYGGALYFESETGSPDSRSALVSLINIGDFFIPIRSPENLQQIDHFIDRLVQLSNWCIDEKLKEFHDLASALGTTLSKVEQAATELRQFPFRGSNSF